jgi:hypothetical protein
MTPGFTYRPATLQPPCVGREPRLGLRHWDVQTFKFCDSIGKVNQGLESQTPPYLSNGDRLGKYFCTIRFKTFENGGVGHLQIPKKTKN